MQMLQGNPLLLPHSLQELLAKDTVQVALVPERKGLFLKHVEYEVSSQVPTDHVRGGRVWAGMCAEEGQGAAGRRAEAQDRASEPRRPAGLSLRLVAQPRFAVPALQDAASQDARPSGRPVCWGKPWQASLGVVCDAGRPRLRIRIQAADPVCGAGLARAAVRPRAACLPCGPPDPESGHLARHAWLSSLSFHFWVQSE